MKLCQVDVVNSTTGYVMPTDCFSKNNFLELIV
jgi:hypothetical protein